MCSVTSVTCSDILGSRAVVRYSIRSELQWGLEMCTHRDQRGVAGQREKGCKTEMGPAWNRRMSTFLFHLHVLKMEINIFLKYFISSGLGREWVKRPANIMSFRFISDTSI